MKVPPACQSVWRTFFFRQGNCRQCHSVLTRFYRSARKFSDSHYPIEKWHECWKLFRRLFWGLSCHFDVMKSYFSDYREWISCSFNRRAIWDFIFLKSESSIFTGYKKNRLWKTKRLTESKASVAISTPKKCVNKYVKKKKTVLRPRTLSLRKESSWTKKPKLGMLVISRMIVKNMPWYSLPLKQYLQWAVF